MKLRLTLQTRDAALQKRGNKEEDEHLKATFTVFFS